MCCSDVNKLVDLTCDNCFTSTGIHCAPLLVFTVLLYWYSLCPCIIIPAMRDRNLYESRLPFVDPKGKWNDRHKMNFESEVMVFLYSFTILGKVYAVC